MRIPDNLQPRRVANELGLSMAQLAMRLGISYHVLHGWSRRGTAPPHTIRFLEVEIPKVKAVLAKELAALPLVERVKTAARPSKLVGVPPPSPKTLIRRRT